jgi:hypothetical protein
MGRYLLIFATLVLFASAQIGKEEYGTESCEDIRVATVLTGPGSPRHNEVWVDNKRGECTRHRIFTVTYSTSLQSEGFCITAASAREHSFHLNIIGMKREKEFQKHWFMDRIVAMQQFVAKLPSDAIVLHVSSFPSLRHVLFFFLFPCCLQPRSATSRKRRTCRDASHDDGIAT